MPYKDPPKTKTDVKLPKPKKPTPQKITVYKESRPKSNKKVKF